MAWLQGTFQKASYLTGSTPQGLVAEADRVGEVDAALVLRTSPSLVHVPGSGLGEIENGKGGKNLLKHQVRFSGMEMDQANRIFYTIS